MVSNVNHMPLPKLVAIAVIVTALVFVFDLFMPLGVAGGVPYVALVLLGIWFPRHSHVYVLGVTGTAMTVIGFFLSPVGGITWVVFTNRSLAIFAIWITAYLIAKKKQAEEKQIRFIQALEDVPDGIILWDSEDRFVNYNRRYKELFPTGARLLHPELTYEKYIHERAESGEVPEAIGREREWIADRVREHRENPNENEYFRDNKWFLIRDTRLSDGGMITVFSDITERKRVEEKLLESEKTLSAFIDSTPDIAILIETDGSIVNTNPAFSELIGHKRKNLTGKNLFDIVSPDTASRRKRDFDEVQRTRKPIHIAAVCHPASGRWWESWSIPIFNDEGNVSRIAFFTHDISEVKQAEEVADTANRAKSEFLSSMSHELRTPMNAILGFTQMLDYNPKEPLTQTQKSSVDQILKGGQHLLTLINDILDLAQVESGKFNLNPERFFPRDVFKECLELVRKMADERSITLSGNKKSDKGLNVDRVRFKQIIVNFLSNAIKYNREGGSITFGCKDKPDGMVFIYVSDTGIGIPEDRLPKIFEPFERLNSEQFGIEGTGIGLTISKKLVEAMGGAIGCESKVGEGTTFWIEFPQAKDIHDIPIHSSSDEAQNLGQMKLPKIAGTVLYVEDNPDNQKLMESIVSQIERLSIISAQNAEQGIELARAKKPDVIILDINLPGMSGIEAVKNLQNHEDTKNIPVLALSAAGTERDIKIGLEAGFLQYLTKPIQISEVVDAIKDGMENSVHS